MPTHQLSVATSTIGLVLTETQVTMAVASYFVARGVRIRSLALPGSGSGIVFRSSEKIDPVMVPDIVAETSIGAAIFLESKPRYSEDDVSKLKKLVSGCYDRSIERVLGGRPTAMFTAVAFSLEKGIRKSALIETDLVFTVDSSLQVRVEQDFRSAMSN